MTSGEVYRYRGGSMSGPLKVWAAITSLEYEGDTLLGIAADAETAKAICRDRLLDEQLSEWEELPRGGWRARSVTYGATTYTVTEHAVQGG
jgi:hypothetical protein